MSGLQGYITNICERKEKMRELISSLLKQKINFYSWKRFIKNNLYRLKSASSNRVHFIHELSCDVPFAGESIENYVLRVKFQGQIFIDARDGDYNDCIIVVIVEQGETE